MKIRSILHLIFLNFVITICLFLFTDFLITKITNPSTDYDEINKGLRIQNEFYHHGLKPMYSGKDVWGGNIYNYCTDINGFRTSCQNKDLKKKFFDILIIGDSVTEALGVSYNDSYVGVFSNYFSKLAIANAGVSSYSTIIYLNKIKKLIEEGVSFKHLFVMVDISDIQDDGARYIFDSKNNVIDTHTPIPKKEKSKLNKLILDNFHYTISFYRFIRYKIIKPEIPINLDRSSWTFNSDVSNYGVGGLSVAKEKSLSYMEELYNFLKFKNIELSVGVYPLPDQIFNDDLKINAHAELWQNFCINKCKFFFNFFEDFNDYRMTHGSDKLYNDFYIYGDVHFNQKGNYFLANSLIEKFKNNY